MLHSFLKDRKLIVIFVSARRRIHEKKTLTAKFVNLNDRDILVYVLYKDCR